MTNVITRFVAVGLLCLASVASAQLNPRHYRYRTDMYPGTVGRGQLTRGGPIGGYFQPVEIIAPDGAAISMIVDGRFEPPQKSSVLAGMLIGEVYRFKVSQIPRNQGFEVFPTIEVISRLHPPPGQKTRFPIPIHLTREELELALNGQFVTRVIYLEDPNTAFPEPDDPKNQRFFEAGPGRDPLKVADELGRPMAILRFGSRVPDALASETFQYGSPPLKRYGPWRKPVPQVLTSVVPIPDSAKTELNGPRKGTIASFIKFSKVKVVGNHDSP